MADQDTHQQDQQQATPQDPAPAGEQRVVVDVRAEPSQALTEEEAFRKEYLDERKSLVDSANEASQNFDKTMIALVTGAVGLTIPFIWFLAPTPSLWGLLLVAWIGFILSLFTILLAYLFAHYAFKKARDILVGVYYPESPQAAMGRSNGWGTAMSVLSIISIVSFVIGVSFFTSFAIVNLPS